MFTFSINHNTSCILVNTSNISVCCSVQDVVDVTCVPATLLRPTFDQCTTNDVPGKRRMALSTYSATADSRMLVRYATHLTMFGRPRCHTDHRTYIAFAGHPCFCFTVGLHRTECQFAVRTPARGSGIAWTCRVVRWVKNCSLLYRELSTMQDMYFY